MLSESEVIDAVCKYLDRHGWSVESRCNEMQRGDDIVAIKKVRSLRAVIEAKGETSSKSYTNRHGKPFSSSQTTVHVARAFYTAVKSARAGTITGMAFPKNRLHQQRVDAIASTLKKLEIEVFWVSSKGEVEVAGYWPAASIS